MMRNILLRYFTATLGMALVALGVAVSLCSNLGTSPISCPPAVLSLRSSLLTFGGFTWLVNFSFIALQVLMLRSRFRMSDLMQIPAVVLFGLLCDAAVWVCQVLPEGGYGLQLVYCLLAIVLTAVGIRIEIDANAWMLSGDKTIAVASEVFARPVSSMKLVFDVSLVVLSALFAWCVFGSFFGDGQHVVIREGTILLALLTGPCMKLTDPLLRKICRYGNQ